MIYRVFSDNKKFRSVEFEKNFNVILADKTDHSTDKDSRNGVGKSSLIEVIHFCLGSDLKKGVGIGSEEFKDWIFSMEFDLLTKKITCRRSTSEPKKIFVEGDLPDLFQDRINKSNSKQYYKLDDWKLILGYSFFELDIETTEEKYFPSFRPLISYFIRTNYSKPFKYFSEQPAWQKQVYNAYLLGLSWEYAQEWQILKDGEKTIRELKKASEMPIFSNVLGSLGKLETARGLEEEEVEEAKVALTSFKVHKDYKKIEETANSLTKDIHKLSNKNVSERKMISFYENSIKNEQSGSDRKEIVALYEKAQVIIPNNIKKRISDVESFHSSIITNRKEYLSDEIVALRTNVCEREKKIEKFSNERAKNMNILQTHGALKEFQNLNQLYNDKKIKLGSLKEKIKILGEIEENKSNSKIKKEELKKKALQDCREKSGVIRRITSLFNANMKYLYNKSGKLIINVLNSGFKFDIDIERSRSAGVSLMKIFCYDLMLAKIWSEKKYSPKILIHDSNMFSDVDERQITKAIQKVMLDSEKYDFQYICFLNSDKLPTELDTEEFKKNVRLALKDDPPEESLFGSRF